MSDAQDSVAKAGAGDGGNDLIARFRVTDGEQGMGHSVVSAPLYATRVAGGAGEAQLFEITDGGPVPVLSQAASGAESVLRWIVPGPMTAGKERIFEYRRVSRRKDGPAAVNVEVLEKGDDVHVSAGGRPVFTYRHGKCGVPEGVDPIFEREGGYIHPLCSPDGAVLTRIQPPDHRHHYGLWNPWTKTRIEGREVDFWNLKAGQGTVRSARIIETTSGPVFGRLRVLLEHVDKTAPGGESVVMREEWIVDVMAPAAGEKVWTIHFASVLNPCAGIPVEIQPHRYQGLTLRARKDWDDTSCVLRTSEGFSKADANGTRARWVHVTGPTEAASGTSGVLLLSHPLNRECPESIRVWPPDFNEGRENVFVNFNPAQESPWTLYPGSMYSLRYRIVVHDGMPAPGWPEQVWRNGVQQGVRAEEQY